MTTNIILKVGTLNSNTLVGDYVVADGDTTNGSNLSITSFSIGSTDETQIKDLSGNVLNDTTLPTGTNMFSGAEIKIDAIRPTIIVNVSRNLTRNFCFAGNLQNTSK